MSLLCGFAVGLGAVVPSESTTASADSPQPAGLVTSLDALTPRTLGRETRPCLPTGQAQLPLAVPPQTVLRFGFGVAGEAWRNGLEQVELTAELVADGEKTTLWRQTLAAGDEAWHDVEVPLDRVAGRRGTLTLGHRTLRGTATPDHLVHWTNPSLGPVTRRGGPNIVLVSIDTLRADHLRCYGYERDTSPNIDRLAREGVLFRQAISPSSWTLPSHASMLTGLDPSHHGAMRFGNRTPLSRDHQTVAERLWDNGYATAGLTGGGFVAASFGFDQGFNRYWSENVLGSLDDELAANIDRALDWIATLDDRPFFLFLHTYAVHAPYSPPAETNIFVDPSYEGRFKTTFTSREQPTYALGVHDFDAPTLHHIEALYDAGIRHVDEVLGRLIAALERRGDTCLLVTSDHGEEFNEHGHILHRQPKLYEELVRVPLIVWCPSRYGGGRVIDQPVSTVDVTPTLLEIAGVPLPAGLDGISLEPTLAGRPQKFREVIVSEVSRSLIGKPGAVRAVRTGSQKLIVSEPDGAAQLFDLADDPGETRDVRSEHPESTARLTELLDAALGQKPRVVVGRARPDQATLDRLRALGYTQ